MRLESTLWEVVLNKFGIFTVVLESKMTNKKEIIGVLHGNLSKNLEMEGKCGKNFFWSVANLLIRFDFFFNILVVFPYIKFVEQKGIHMCGPPHEIFSRMSCSCFQIYQGCGGGKK